MSVLEYRNKVENIRLPRAVCKIVGEVLHGSPGSSHATLEALFVSAGAPGDPPDLAHSSKWKEWLFRAGQDPDVDSLLVLGNVLEEFMDIGPVEDSEGYEEWKKNRNRVVAVLEDNRLRYYRGGQVLPNSQHIETDGKTLFIDKEVPIKPSSVDELILVLTKGLRRAMHPLTHRRKGSQNLSFSNEYDVQDLLHSLLRPWVFNIRPEEFTPSLAGSSARMDFLLPKYNVAIELKFVRDRNHAKKIGDELILDIEHYLIHPDCNVLWCVVYDQDSLLTNAESLKEIGGDKSSKNGNISVKVIVL